ncbi:MAG: DinB family protein [Longimicrobiales bacterium]
MSSESFLTDISGAEDAVAAFFGSLTPDEFVQRVDSAWPPAEHVMHLNIVVSAVARGFSVSPLLLRLRFGKAREPSRTYEQLRDHYRSLLAAGGEAPPKFVPPRDEGTVLLPKERQEAIMARWQRVNARLRAAVPRWSERDLDRIRMPHPLLGKLTAREMLFFTIYHGHHHVAAAQRRLAQQENL